MMVGIPEGARMEPIEPPRAEPDLAEPTPAEPARLEPPPVGPPPLESLTSDDDRTNRRSAWIGGGIAALILTGLLGYIIGLQVGRHQNSASTVTGSSSTGLATPSSGGSKRALTGSITAVNATLITITDQASGSKVTVELTPLTTIRVLDYGSPASLKPGGNITVMGRRLSDGTMRARIVTVNLAGPAPVPGLPTSTPTTAP
jgi:hypothetical protein